MKNLLKYTSLKKQLKLEQNKTFKEWLLINKIELVLLVLFLLVNTLTSVFLIDNLTYWTSWLSIVSTNLGIICTILIALKSKWNYVFGILNVATYSAIAFNEKLYFSFVLYGFFYVLLNIYGYYYWNKKTNNSELKISNSKREVIVYTVSAVLLLAITIPLGYMVFNNAYPTLDSFNLSLSLLGMFFMIRAFKEQYYIWNIVNIIGVVIWSLVLAGGQTYATTIVIQFSIYLLISIFGYFNWFKK